MREMLPAENYAHKPPAYFQNLRREIVNEVPLGSRSVLEIGCAQGRTAAALKAEGRAQRVVGVEILGEAANKAKDHLDQVFVGNVEQMELPFRSGQFDVLILADVLEHLVEPWQVLSRLTNFLTPDGLVIASLPNVRNWRVVMPLLFFGKWEYQESGIMDRTHLRFFTKSSILDLFRESQYAVTKMMPIGEKSKRFARVGLHFLSELTAVQYIVVGTRLGMTPNLTR